MESLLHYGKFLLVADAILLAVVGLWVIALSRRSPHGKREPLPIRPVVGVIVFVESCAALIDLGLRLLVGVLL